MKDITGTRELSYAELEHMVEELEDLNTANDQLMQETSKQNDAMKAAIAEWYNTKRPHENLLMTPAYFFDKYKDWSKELLILEVQKYMLALRSVYREKFEEAKLKRSQNALTANDELVQLMDEMIALQDKRITKLEKEVEELKGRTTGFPPNFKFVPKAVYTDSDMIERKKQEILKLKR